MTYDCPMGDLSSYDPFDRGAHPVGVRTERWLDDQRDRPLDVEIWYPASVAVAGRDLDPLTQDRFPAVWLAHPDDEPEEMRQTAVRDAAPADEPGPLVLFSHGYAGFRREATFVCTHLASHGYTVIGADHLGSTSWDVVAMMTGPEPMRRLEHREQMVEDRKGDVPFLIAEATRRGLSPQDDVGVTGISLGGWTTLISPAVEPRVTVIAAMCPAGGRSPVSPGRNAMTEGLDLSWSRPVETLMMLADQDSWLPLDGQFQTIAKLPGAPRVVILLDADHNHFVDDIETGHEWFREFTRSLAVADPDSGVDWARIADNIGPYSELTPADVAYELWRGLTVAHFDAHLRQDGAAADLLGHELAATAADRGASIVTFTRPEVTR